MEISSAKWLDELETMDDPAFNYEYQMNPLDYFFMDDLNFDPSFSSNINDRSFHAQPSSNERPAKQLKTNSWSSCTTHQIMANNNSSSSSSRIISFDNSNSPSATSQHLYARRERTSSGSDQFCGNNDTRRARAMSRSPFHAQDHVLAERKRREKLSQRFIALSAVVPGLKKMDKASVLGEAIKYLKHLEDRVKTLEEEVATKKTMESVVLVKKSQICSDDVSSSSVENSSGSCDQPLPEIEVIISDKNVLVKIHCEKQVGWLVKILTEIEKLHLNVINSSVLPFGKSTFYATVVAQMGNDFRMTALKDLVRDLQQALL